MASSTLRTRWNTSHTVRTLGPLHEHAQAGKLIVVLTNECGNPFNTTLSTVDSVKRTWVGYSFQGSVNGNTFNVSLGAQSTAGPRQGFATTLAPYTIQWWYEQDSVIDVLI